MHVESKIDGSIKGNQRWDPLNSKRMEASMGPLKGIDFIVSSGKDFDPSEGE